MRVRNLLFPFLGFLLASTLHADDWQPDPQFRSLFNGKDLTGWCFRAKADRKSTRVGAVVEKFDGKTQSSDAGRYSAKDGILTVNFPKGRARLIAQLYTVEEFPRDFVLKLEFRASVNADSGIFLRQPQLQCRDYLVAGPYKDLKKYKAAGLESNRGRRERPDGPLHLQRRSARSRVRTSPRPAPSASRGTAARWNTAAFRSRCRKRVHVSIAAGPSQLRPPASGPAFPESFFCRHADPPRLRRPHSWSRAAPNVSVFLMGHLKAKTEFEQVVAKATEERIEFSVTSVTSC